MADISKINAVALANIAKLDAVTAANIAKVNGLTFATAPAFVGLLDETYGSGAAAAYSVRRLASATTVLLRVRRDTGTGGAEDDDEADVAYDSNNELSLDSAISNTSAGVTATTLGQFINVGTVNGTTYTNPDNLTVTASCFVDEWYDQAGSNDAAQSILTRQPVIHEGTVNTDLITENGKAAVKLTDNLSNEDYLNLTTSINSQNFSYFIAGSIGSATASRTQILSTSGGSPYLRCDNANRYVIVKPGDFDFLNGSVFDGTQALNSLVRSSATTVTSYQDGSQTGTISTLDASNMSFNQIASYITSSQTDFWLAQELVFWESDQDSAGNRTDIEDNINAEFGIY